MRHAHAQRLPPHLRAGGVPAYTLVVTTFDQEYSESENTLFLGFCDGGVYCTVADATQSPAKSGFQEVG